MADDEYLTPAQLADQLHVTVLTVRRWITSGRLSATKAGPRRWLIRRSDIAKNSINNTQAARWESVT